MHRAVTLVFITLISINCFAQEPDRSCDLRRPQRCAVDVIHDQVGLWSSPARTRPHDLLWILPFAAATGVAIHYDARAMQQLGSNPSTLSTARSISNWGAIYAPLGTVGIGYIAGSLEHNDHLRRTAMLAGEAMLDGIIVDEGLKYMTNRERPDVGETRGEFWAHGFGGYPNGRSFPSGHSAVAWSFAHVIADEYPHWWSRIAVYGLATSVSATRVIARQHFPSDVIVGSTFGYLVGGYVFRHHDAHSEHSLNVTPEVIPGGGGVILTLR